MDAITRGCGIRSGTWDNSAACVVQRRLNLALSTTLTSRAGGFSEV
ncbi:hypothetical protein BSU04_42390 [Caballeronia sordidicola]|uniref:Uncharacterized protein n=1 Tax=Caballeronia sordidicola TaxID=196367 RepID=A0A226WM64_CABSO|nr:hypothetical protein BSU04_42390 [Caballeronia sordidicola]